MEHWQTFGHKNIKHILELQLASKTFSHAYLFTGPQGVGKRELALEFAGKILETEQVTHHPDLSELHSEQEITVEAVRMFMSRQHFKPFAAKYTVGIIDNAQLLNAQSANAILKTLEEPSPSTVLILVCEGSDMLPTIVSRCQCFSFAPLSLPELKSFAQQRGLKLSQEAFELSFGSVGRLVHFSSKEGFNQVQDYVQKLKEVKALGKAERLLAIKEYAELEDLELHNLLTTWTLWQKQQVYAGATDWKLLEHLQEALRKLLTNKNKKLILQTLLLSM